ncbi:glycosyltransferase Family 4 family protein [Rhodococcus sp. MTM3W5.2]|nr:glycosyltransferase Family 4 family protein [Rhodococcus sp. MTM3W5.2]
MVCPYSFDVPGGVQAHVVELASVLIERGHKVSVLAPASEGTELPDFVVSAGRAVAIPYNGSVARLSFGPVSYARVRRWIVDNDFDVLHIHEPNAPSLSMLAMKIAEGPIVATFHTSTTKSLVLSTFQGVLAPYLEKISGRIAVSELARRWQMESLGSDAVEIPNGVDVPAFANADPLPGYPRAGGTVLFLGRYDESRKGMAVLLEALPELVAKHPDLEILVVGRGTRTGCARTQAGMPGTCGCWGRSPTRRRPRPCAARTSTARRISAARVSASCSWRRWRLARRWWPVNWTLSVGCCATAPPECWCRSAIRPRWPPRSIRCSVTRTAVAPWSARPPRWWPSTTGRWSRSRSCVSTRR